MSTYDQPSSHEELELIAKQLRARNFNPHLVASAQKAQSTLIDLIPQGASVMTGSSTTLDQIGFSKYLASGKHSWQNLYAQIGEQNDEAKRHQLRRESVLADYFVSSVNALTKDGLLVAVDNTGSRVGAMPFAAKNLILVIGSQKITNNLDEAFKRIRQYVFPKEDKRLVNAYGIHSNFGKWVILENEVNPSRIHTILVEQALGF